jgi:glycosyltransferase involved in cell wall biosynthesis
MRVTYISWAPHCSRSDYTARELGGVSHMVYWASLGSRPGTVWLKYLGQALRTWWILLREHPQAVFVMSPPVFAGLVVYPYCVVRRIPFVIDAHTGAFQNPRWRHFFRLQYWLCRRAATTIVSNVDLAALLAAKGADATILPDVPVEYPSSDVSFKRNGFLVAVVCSFDRDEPIDVLIDAARALPDVQFLMTGDPEKLASRVTTLPDNLTLTGFLENAAFGQLLRDADVVMALTTGKQTMLRSAYEAIYQGTPVIVSNSPVLAKEFPNGAILVENAAQPIIDAIRQMQVQPTLYRAQAAELRQLKRERWNLNKKVLLAKFTRSFR